MRAIEFARWIGEHALPVFAGALLLLLFCVGAGWFAVHRYYVRPRQAQDAAAARASIAVLVFGFATILMAALLFATVPRWIGTDGWVARADVTLTDAIRRSVSRPVLEIFAAVTVLANTPVLWTLAIAGAVVLLGRRDYILTCIWIAAFAGNGILTRVLKSSFARARPPHEHELLTVDGFSFPSGHSSGAVVAYGMLAYALIRATPVVWHLPIALTATAVTFSIACSRVFLRVHYASDAAAGLALGLAWLAACIVAAEFSRRAGAHAP